MIIIIIIPIKKETLKKVINNQVQQLTDMNFKDMTTIHHKVMPEILL